MRNDKFLIQFVNQLTKKDIFIAVWIAGAALFTYLLWSYQKKVNQRNFKSQQSANKSHALKVTKTDLSRKDKT
jgi:threonine/homoserine/homoserine lactone efflux protein